MGEEILPRCSEHNPSPFKRSILEQQCGGGGCGGRLLARGEENSSGKVREGYYNISKFPKTTGP